MGKQIHLIHGFLEQKGGNISGMADLQKKIVEQNPGAYINDYTQDEFDGVKLDPTGPIILVGRSWGGAAAFRYIDTHPEITFDLLVAFDPVTNFFKAPRSWPCIGWKRRKNLKFFLSLNESESWLKGHPVFDKAPYKEVEERTLYVHSKTGKRILKVRESDWYKEIILPNDPATKPGSFDEFKAHFTVSKDEFCVAQALERIKAV